MNKLFFFYLYVQKGRKIVFFFIVIVRQIHNYFICVIIWVKNNRLDKKILIYKNSCYFFNTLYIHTPTTNHSLFHSKIENIIQKRKHVSLCIIFLFTDLIRNSLCTESPKSETETEIVVFSLELQT